MLCCFVNKEGECIIYKKPWKTPNLKVLADASHVLRHLHVRVLACFLVGSCLISMLACSSCSITSKSYQEFADQIQSNIGELIPSVSPIQGGFVIPEDKVVSEIGSKQDLFYLIQDSLYRFDSEIYIQIESFALFSQFWDELSVESALHSAFEHGEVKIEYTDASPCVMKLIFSFNAAGRILQKYVNNEPMTFTDTPSKNLYEEAMRVLNEYVSSDMSDVQKEIAIHDYVVKNTKYASDGISESLATAESVLLLGIGQCQGYAEAMALLLTLSGIETRVISGMAQNADTSSVAHAWNQVQIGDVWYHVDATWNDPIPDGGEYVYRTYLNRSDEFMKADHVWSDLFPACPLDAQVQEDSLSE